MHNLYMDGFTVYIHADVEWLNERMHEQIKVNFTEKSWNNLEPHLEYCR